MDFINIEKIAPEYWRNSFFSLARFYGRIVVQGMTYILDPETDYLVREDVWRREMKDARKAEAERRKWKKAREKEENPELF